MHRRVELIEGSGALGGEAGGCRPGSVQRSDLCLRFWRKREPRTILRSEGENGHVRSYCCWKKKAKDLNKLGELLM